MMGAVFLDRHGDPLRPAFIWADDRSIAQAQRLRDALGADRGYALLGHRVHATYPLPKMMWVRDSEPEVWAATRTVCVAKDFVTARLTGRLVTDPSDASSTDAFDLVAGRWSEEVLAAAGIEPGVLPEVVPSTTVAGGLVPAAAEALGLPAGTPVVVGGGDGPIASVGAGAVDPSDGAYVCLGSSAWVAFCSDRPVLDPLQRSFTFRHVVPGRFVPTATMQAGGASLEWIAGVVDPSPSPGRIPGLLAEAADGRAAEDGLYFLPYLLGERSPHWDPSASGTFVGLRRHHTRGDLVRAVLEGVAFNLRSCLGSFPGAAIPSVDVIGGGATSDVWMQVLADVWGIPVRRRSIVDAATSLGAAVTGLVALADADFGLARELSEVTAEFQPQPDRAGMYAAGHDRFTDTYARLADRRDAGAPAGTTAQGDR
jgi:xylulokinase